MSKIDRLYSILKTFQDERESLRLTRERSLSELEEHNGSAYFSRRVAEVNCRAAN